jgi:predicted lipase
MLKKIITIGLFCILFSGSVQAAASITTATKQEAKSTATGTARTAMTKNTTDTVADSASTTPVVMTKEEFRKKYRQARLIAMTMAASNAAYEGGVNTNEWAYMHKRGWTFLPFVSQANKVDAHFVIATNPRKHYAIIAFRGSHSKNDWKQNLTLDQINYGGHSLTEFQAVAKEKQGPASIPKVHKGFNNYVTAALALKADFDGDHAVDDIVEKLKARPDFKLYITGHSLGGAAAILYAERLVALGVNKDQIPVISFGAPAIGNEAFVKAYGDKINLLRVETTMDPIPFSLKLLGDKYKLFGKEFKFHVSKKYTDNFHDNAFYMDYALRNYYNVQDEGLNLGYLHPRKTKQVTEGKPLVAVVMLTHPVQVNDQYAPNISRFVLDEYRSFLPSYVVLDSKPSADFWDNGQLGRSFEAAEKAGADYLLVADIGRKRMGKSASWYVKMEQTVFRLPEKSAISMQSASDGVRLMHGITQAALKNLNVCRAELLKKLPFTELQETAE